MPSEQAFDMVCLGGGVAAGELVREHRLSGAQQRSFSTCSIRNKKECRREFGGMYCAGK